MAASESFEVNSKLTRAQQIVKADGVDGTPSIVIDGKYRVTGQSAGGFEQLIALVDWPAQKEIDAKKPGAKKKK